MVMIYNETKAIEELRAVSRDVKYHLDHIHGNFLTNIECALEIRNPTFITEAITEMKEELRRFGINF